MVENQGFSSVSKIIASVYESGLYKLLENVQIGKSNLAHQLTRGFISSLPHPERVQTIKIAETFSYVFYLVMILYFGAAIAQIFTLAYFYRGAILNFMCLATKTIARSCKIVGHKFTQWCHKCFTTSISYIFSV